MMKKPWLLRLFAAMLLCLELLCPAAGEQISYSENFTYDTGGWVVSTYSARLFQAGRLL